MQDSRCEVRCVTFSFTDLHEPGISRQQTMSRGVRLEKITGKRDLLYKIFCVDIVKQAIEVGTSIHVEGVCLQILCRVSQLHFSSEERNICILKVVTVTGQKGPPVIFKPDRCVEEGYVEHPVKIDRLAEEGIELRQNNDAASQTAEPGECVVIECIGPDDIIFGLYLYIESLNQIPLFILIGTVGLYNSLVCLQANLTQQLSDRLAEEGIELRQNNDAASQTAEPGECVVIECIGPDDIIFGLYLYIESLNQIPLFILIGTVGLYNSLVCLQANLTQQLSDRLT